VGPELRSTTAVRRRRARDRITRTTATVVSRLERSTSSRDKPSTFGCSSSSVAQPKNTSLVARPVPMHATVVIAAATSR
jgi:hypothetical protein